MVNGGKTLYVTRVNPFVNRVNRGVHRPEFYGLGTDPADVAGVGRPARGVQSRRYTGFFGDRCGKRRGEFGGR